MFEGVPQIRTGHWKAMQWASQTWARLNMVLIPDLDMLRWAAEKGRQHAHMLARSCFAYLHINK